MKFNILFFIITLLLLPIPASAADHELPQIDTDQYELSGDTKLACEAILCLSSGTRPGECGPALSRYFGISKKKMEGYRPCPEKLFEPMPNCRRRRQYTDSRRCNR
ncbi:TrbM/KikA/MpfK family conjugal transfer protein [uncultured Bilophila sp.]|uniref:TrbM/KikA/MpfK family conjugal transfer protein n=1 Tax=uncultured Bilophila sp. TaxID=529385 RepID=UPI0034A0A671